MKKNKKNEYDVKAEIASIDRLFRDLEKDKTLPTFGEHFMFCLIKGIAEHVNLKKLYPDTYTVLSKRLEEHNKMIKGAQKKKGN